MKEFQLNQEVENKICQRIAEIDNLKDSTVEYMGCSGCRENEKRCGMLLTKKCQLKCVYCYEKKKSKETMDFQTAKQILDKELEDESVERIHIDLFGGEPFLAFDVMKEIVDYLKNKRKVNNFYITTITNGVAIHGDIQKWLLENKDVIECPLSLDGTREMQERNRPGSFDRIDLDFFTEKLPGTRAKMTISPNTLCDLAKGTIFLHERKFSPQNWLAYGVQWQDDCGEILKEELNKLICYYLEHPEIPESLLLKLPYKDICVRYRSCDAGKAMAMYDVQGKKWPCHMFLPMALGEEKAKIGEELNIHKDKRNGEYCDEECQKCPIGKSCIVCHGFNYNSFGTINGRDASVCMLTKIIYRAKAYLAAQKWSIGLYKELEELDEKAMLEAITLCMKL